MKAEYVFRTPGPLDPAREGTRLFFTGGGYRPNDDGTAEPLQYVRGSRWKRVFSLRIEQWPTTLHVLLFDISDEETGVLLRYEVRTGLHLIGALDKATLEAEAALLEDYLLTGRRRNLGNEIASVRRPVIVATFLNMAIAVAVITWIGVMGNFPLHWVAIAAVVVAFLDGVVIMAFADLLLEGARSTPRLRDSEDPPRVTADRESAPSATA